MREFGELLRTHRIHAGLTQQQLADFAMVSVRAIRDLECGRTRSPRAETVRLLADGLRLDEGSRADLQQAGGRTSGRMPVAPPAPMMAIVGREAEAAALGALLVEGAGSSVGGVEEGRCLPGSGGSGEGQGLAGSGSVATRQRLAGPAGGAGPAEHRLATAPAPRTHTGPSRVPRRLVTITGVSGSGKTRLALEVAGELHLRRGWSVLWYPAARPSVDDDQDTLLVTDHRPDLRLLDAHPRLRVVVTALAPTGLPGEHVFPLGPLADDAALRLLLTLVHRVRPGFRPEPSNQAALTGLVRELDGLPSALEFAAGWFMVYSPQHLLERLRSNPMDPTSAHLRDSLRRSLSTLDEQQRATLERMIDHECHDDAHALSVRGLVRRAGPRYEVLNLVRAAVREPVSGPHFAGGVALTWPC
ncbi:helix-turn-helix domain-containing protein [Lentzea aerocolonigenes]|uniref:helix-turn-helix domain-containing protein n=1 Tax=Lentzea aerocolonigenes TaxID=68170 RepID=UPI0004C30B33|nr:helix-turn-helix domain-containing protein [Lentzea aerocolonigenes]MCP2249248.1 Helix-turn-helix domain-containing protein [Lentzea aerocolonigenes]